MMAASSDDTRLGDYHLRLTLTRERRNKLCSDTAAFLAENNLLHLGKYFVFGSLKEISFAHPGTIFQPVLQRRPEALIFSRCSRTLQKKRSLLKWGTEELGPFLTPQA
jgi:hypothetical protein